MSSSICELVTSWNKFGQQFRREVLGLVPLAHVGTDLALGVSEYNRSELEALGFPRTGVLPIAVDTDRLRRAPAVPSPSSADGRSPNSIGCLRR